MRSDLSNERMRRRISWILVVALLPMLTFLGHWPAVDFDIPGTNLYVTLPLAAGTGPDGAGSGHDHSRHCHGDSAGCSDVPAAAGIGFGLMNEALTLAVASGVFVALALRWWTPGAPHSLVPETQPPRAALSHA